MISNNAKYKLLKKEMQTKIVYKHPATKKSNRIEEANGIQAISKISTIGRFSLNLTINCMILENNICFTRK